MSRSETSENKSPETFDEASSRALTPAAQRALAEAEARRRERDSKMRPLAKELGGTDGPDPVRYGDWENGGIASDF
jgi:hypothetical protein